LGIERLAEAALVPFRDGAEPADDVTASPGVFVGLESLVVRADLRHGLVELGLRRVELPNQPP